MATTLLLSHFSQTGQPWLHNDYNLLTFASSTTVWLQQEGPSAGVGSFQLRKEPRFSPLGYYVLLPCQSSRYHLNCNFSIQERGQGDQAGQSLF